MIAALRSAQRDEDVEARLLHVHRRGLYVGDMTLDDARLVLADNDDLAVTASTVLELAKIAVVVAVVVLEMLSAVPSVVVAAAAVTAVSPHRRGREDRGSEKSRD
jgi:hypothetical protein